MAAFTKEVVRDLDKLMEANPDEVIDVMRDLIKLNPTAVRNALKSHPVFEAAFVNQKSFGIKTGPGRSKVNSVMRNRNIDKWKAIDGKQVEDSTLKGDHPDKINIPGSRREGKKITKLMKNFGDSKPNKFDRITAIFGGGGAEVEEAPKPVPPPKRRWGSVAGLFGGGKKEVMARAQSASTEKSWQTAREDSKEPTESDAETTPGGETNLSTPGGDQQKKSFGFAEETLSESPTEEQDEAQAEQNKLFEETKKSAETDQENQNELFQATENAQEEKPKQLEKQKTIGERISEGLASLVPTFSENAEKQILDDASDTETDVETPILVDEHLDISEAPLSPIIKPEVVCVAEPEAGHAEQNKLFEETQKQEEQNKLFEETQKQEQEESAPADLGEPKKRKMSITETIGAGLSAIVSTISGGNATPKATLDEAPAMPENPEPAKVEEKVPEPGPAEAPAPVEAKTDTEAAPAPKKRERRERKPRDRGGLKNKWAAKKIEAEAEAED